MNLILLGMMIMMQLFVGDEDERPLFWFSGATEGDQIVPNWSFEDWKKPDEPERWFSEAMITLAQSEERVTHGSFSCKMTPDIGGRIYQDIEGLTPEKSYVVSVDVYIDAVDDGPIAYLRVYDGFTNTNMSENTTVVRRTPLTISVAKVAPATGAIRIRLEGYSGVPADIFWDNVRLSLDPNKTEVISYLPYSPRADDSDLINLDEDGAEQISVTLNNVWEPIEAFFNGDYADARVSGRLLTSLFSQARLRSKEEAGKKLYLYHRAKEEFPIARAELMFGRIMTSDKTLTHQMGLSDKNPRVQARIFVKRRPLWEFPEVQVPLSNRWATLTADALRVDNHDDSGADNFVEIAPQHVIGGWPAPIRLEITNTYNNSVRLGRVYVAHNWRSDPANFSHALQGQASTIGTVTGNGGASGGAYITHTWSGSAVTEIFRWTLSSDLLTAAGGHLFRIMPYLFGVMTASHSDLLLRWDLRIEGLTVLDQSEWAPVTQLYKLIEGPTLRLPPKGSGVLQHPLTLSLYAQRLDGASTTLQIDYLQLSPLDGWRELRSRGFNCQYLARIVEDSIAGELYTDTWTTPGRVQNYVANGREIQLQPLQRQRLYFLMRGDTSDTIARTAAIKVFYRPRSLVLP